MLGWQNIEMLCFFFRKLIDGRFTARRHELADLCKSAGGKLAAVAVSS